MKKMLNTAMVYFILAIAAGVFYREFTKWHGYTGRTVLGYVHTHLFVFGMMLFLIVTLFCRQEKSLLQNKVFKCFYILYNISLPFMACIMLTRGILQVQNVNLTKAVNAMISGFAGISHILLTISLGLFFGALQKSLAADD
ncbi:MAG: DUF2871 domain-containing protein [Lachnospiraceae bacterium]|jgi:hypothetical protein|nr:DUF2871 domain-containing protein [Lachnospiraceae bacterium]